MMLVTGVIFSLAEAFGTEEKSAEKTYSKLIKLHCVEINLLRVIILLQ
jgi:hypothetical protein